MDFWPKYGCVLLAKNYRNYNEDWQQAASRSHKALVREMLYTMEVTVWDRVQMLRGLVKAHIVHCFTNTSLRI